MKITYTLIAVFQVRKSLTCILFGLDQLPLPAKPAGFANFMLAHHSATPPTLDKLRAS
jgi:hypothetical protein